MNARFFAQRPRRQLLAAGVLFWTTLALSPAADITLKDLRITCVASVPTPTYTINMTVVNGMDCPMAWITLHSSATFSPHIINFNSYVTPGGQARARREVYWRRAKCVVYLKQNLCKKVRHVIGLGKKQTEKWFDTQHDPANENL